MKFKLCRLFNARFMTIHLIVFLIMATFIIIFEKNEPLFDIVLVLLILAFVHLYLCPSRFEVSNNEITMRDAYKRLAPKFSFVIQRGRTGYKRANLTISHITKIEYKSNSIEKLFGVGRMVVYGRLELTRKDGEHVADDTGKLQKFHKIYGIKHFKKAKEEIKQALLGAEHCEI